jgi:hypothetical protein
VAELSVEDGEDQDLRAAIENLYVAFSRYPPRMVPVEGCPHCVSKVEEVLLASKPLRQLTAKDFGRYEYKAMTTWGSENDFKHFLPRLLELVVRKEIDQDLIPNKLNYAQWRNWPQDEQNAIETYLLCIWKQILQSPDESYEVANWLNAIAGVIDDLRPFLKLWEQSCSSPALHHLAEYIEHNGWSLLDSDPVKTWLLNPTTVEKFEQRYFENPNESYANEIATVVDYLRTVQRAKLPSKQ